MHCKLSETIVGLVEKILSPTWGLKCLTLGLPMHLMSRWKVWEAPLQYLSMAVTPVFAMSCMVSEYPYHEAGGVPLDFLGSGLELRVELLRCLPLDARHLPPR